MSRLAGVGVAVTRPGADSGRLGALLRGAGAEVVHWPCIRFDSPAGPDELAASMHRLADYDWIVLTSPRAARRWLEAAGGDRRGTKLAVVGPATAAVLERARWPVARVARTHSAEGVVAAFEAAGDAAGARVLFPCSDRAGEDVTTGLRRLGAVVDRVVAYHTVTSPPAAEVVLSAVGSGAVRVVTFTSPSTVEGFLAGLGAEVARLRDRLGAAAIGPTTAAALSGAGWSAVVAEEPTLEALVSAAARAVGRPASTGRTGAASEGP